jgi:hypothetical protein
MASTASRIDRLTRLTSLRDHAATRDNGGSMTTLTTKKTSVVRLEVQDLMATARQETGFSDFGDPWFLAPLAALVTFVNEEGGLSSIDVPPVRHIIDMLCDRLRLADYLKRNPKVLDEKLNVVGIILGQARGGSTLTQRLVARCPQLTSTSFWELFNPVPRPDEKRGDPVERRKIGDDEVASWRKHMPEYVGMHPLDSSFHEEDLWLMDRGFLSYLYNIHFNIPSYFDWSAAQDHTKALQELQVWLKVLQHQAPEREGKKWVLKNQDHIMSLNLPAVFRMFPEAKAIQTHRALEQALPSLASVQSVHIRTSGTTNFDKHEMGERLTHQYLKVYKHMMAVHKERPDLFIDIQYRDLVANPIESYRKMIEGMGLVCGPEDIAAAVDWMSQNGRGTHPPHGYKPEDFGFTVQGLRDSFEFYHQAFLK